MHCYRKRLREQAQKTLLSILQFVDHHASSENPIPLDSSFTNLMQNGADACLRLLELEDRQ